MADNNIPAMMLGMARRQSQLRAIVELQENINMQLKPREGWRLQHLHVKLDNIAQLASAAAELEFENILTLARHQLEVVIVPLIEKECGRVPAAS